jgi:hypothetical protein
LASFAAHVDAERFRREVGARIILRRRRRLGLFVSSRFLSGFGFRSRPGDGALRVLRGSVAGAYHRDVSSQDEERDRKSRRGDDPVPLWFHAWFSFQWM